MRHYSTLVLTIKAGKLDFIGEYNKATNHGLKDHLSINPYWYGHTFTGIINQCISELVDAMNDGNWNRSDIQTDYFDVGWYIDIDVGSYDKPYQFIA